jgi:hypothetical protein
MPIEATKALRWASDPATHGLMVALAHCPPDDAQERHLRENRLLRSASKLFGLPKHGIPIGQQRERSLLWLVNLVNNLLEHQANHDPIHPTVPTEAEAPSGADA